MKTLRVTLADIEGAAHASTAAATSVTVSVAYSGQVVLTSGTVIPAAVKSKNLGSAGVVDFSVYASDDPVVRSEYRGFAVVVTATVRGPVGSPTTKLVRTVKPLESMGSVVQLGSLPPAEGLPAQWVTVDEVLSDFDARLDSLEDDPRLRDTGWRNINSLVSPAVAGGDLRIRRIGNEVSFWSRNLSFTENISSTDKILPTSGGFTASGFRPDPSARIAFRCNRSNQIATVMNTTLYRSGDSLAWVWYSLERVDQNAPRVFTLDSGFPIAGYTSWITDEAWPATLPGSPA